MNKIMEISFTRRKLLGFVACLFTVLVSSVLATESTNSKATMPSATRKDTEAQVFVYYFHGTVRCETCQKIEKQSRDAIQRRFDSELAAKRLVFEVLNYDKPENKSYQEKYKLPCPSLVIVQRKDGKDEKWKLLEDTWKLVEDPSKFNKYVEDEVDNFLHAK